MRYPPIENDRPNSWRPPGGVVTSGALPLAASLEADVARECRCGWLYPPEHVLCGRCGEPLRPSPVPKAIPGRLELEKRVAQGGYGVVYRGIDLALGRRVAVKTRAAVASDDVERLRREAQALASLSHRHVATVYGFEVYRGRPLLVMEWVDGGTLAERIPLPLGAALEVALAASEALDRLHSAGIVHRDVKPGNIGFTRAGELKLFDFGLAEAPGSEEEPDRRLAGTLAYLAPEAFVRGRPSPALDVWSLSVVFYESLTGCRPFHGESPRTVAEAICEMRHRPIEEHLPSASGELRAFFADAFDREGDRRPTDAAELRRRLEALRRALASR